MGCVYGDHSLRALNQAEDPRPGTVWMVSPAQIHRVKVGKVNVENSAGSIDPGTFALNCEGKKLVDCVIDDLDQMERHMAKRDFSPSVWSRRGHND